MSKNSESTSKTKCYLKCLKSDRPNIHLTDAKTFIGRSRETQIDDAICSRKQMLVKANLNDGYVLLKCTGTNKSALNGFVLEPNKPYEAEHGDVIEIIHNQYMYEVVFDPPPASKIDSKKRDLEKSRHIKDSKKRVSESPLMGESSSSVKKMKQENGIDNASTGESSSSVKKIKEDNSIGTGSTDKAATDDKWEKIDGGKLYVYTTKGCKPSSKIAAYDMDGTLIKTKSGNVFAKDFDDWQIWSTEVPRKLQHLNDKGFKMVIFTNQASISKGKMRIEDFKLKLEKIVKKMNVPMQCYISTGKGTYRKPMTGMFEYLKDHKNDNIPIDMNESLYVGDAAGRPERKHEKCKKDHSSADRLMALNAGLNFLTPEEHFLNAKKIDWIRPEFDPTTYKIPDSLTDPKTAQLTSSTSEVVLMVGFPGSGKSFVAKKYLEENGYRIANRDKLGTWQKCVSVMESELEAKKRVVIDNTNPDVESRKRYIDAAKKFKVPIRCFVMATSYKHARHNNLFRELTDSNHLSVNDMVFNSFKAKYKEPTVTEGFTDVVKINFIPKFGDANQEKLYKMYLLDK